MTMTKFVDPRMKMKIALVYPTTDPISPANWSGTPYGLAKGLESNGVEIVPISAKAPPGLHESVALLSRMTGRRGAVADRMGVRHTTRSRVIARRLNDTSVDVVLAMGTEMYDLAKLARGRRIVTYDDGTLKQMWEHPASDITKANFPARHVERWIRRQSESSRAAEMCFVSTQWAARSFVDDYGVPEARVKAIGMGHRPRAAAGFRDWAEPRFLFVGIDWVRKNGDRVLHAFQELRREFPTATLDVVGRHPQIDHDGVRGHGLLALDDGQAQRRIDELYAQATCFVVPSTFDPSPIAYLEAASAGLPVIATTEGGAGELIGDGSVTVRPDDDAGLLNAMRLLANGETAMNMGLAASKSAASSSWASVARRLLDALEEEAVEAPRAVAR